MDKVAQFTNVVEMPFNTCKSCGMRFVIISVFETETKKEESSDNIFEACIFQVPGEHGLYCPYCGKKIEGE